MKTCIPIMARTYEESIELINGVSQNIDMIEWRIDCLDENFKPGKFADAWNRIREAAKRPVIVTFRTRKQGGAKELSASDYNLRMRKIILNIKPSYIDIELNSCGSDAYVRMLSVMARKRGIGVIVSHHDLNFTESPRDIDMLLCRMKYIGADIPKVAFTPQSKDDVANLIQGAYEAHKKVGDIIAISMGKIGQKTRTDGDTFGSVINFVKPIGSCYDESKDIGQIEIE